MRNIIWSLLFVSYSLDVLKRAFFEKEAQKSLQEVQPIDEKLSFNQQNLISTNISKYENELKLNKKEASLYTVDIYIYIMKTQTLFKCLN